MNISIFGLGHVGCVTLACLSRNGHRVIGVDISDSKVSQLAAGESPVVEKDIQHIIREEFDRGRITATQDYCQAILETEISIIAVEVPVEATGHANLQQVLKLAATIGRILHAKNEHHIVAIRSDVQPGTAEKVAQVIEEYSGKKHNRDFSVVSNPHFLRKGTAVDDYFRPPYSLIGAEKSEAAEKIAQLYRNLPAEVIVTDCRTAEVMKYVSNSFHALKVAFSNEVASICGAMNLDSQKVMDLFCADKKFNLSAAYLRPGFAFGGSGLRKNLKGLLTLAHDHHVSVPVLDSIERSNSIQIERAVELVKKSRKRKLGFLGLSFKPGSHELAHSPAAILAETLLGKGYEITIYDRHLNRHREQMEIHHPHLARLMKSHIAEVLNESELLIVTNREKEYVDVLLNVETEHPVIDLVKLPEAIRQKNNYMAIH